MQLWKIFQLLFITFDFLHIEMVDNVAVSVIWSLIGAELFPVILGDNQTVTSGISTQLDSILQICSFHQFLL